MVLKILIYIFVLIATKLSLKKISQTFKNLHLKIKLTKSIYCSLIKNQKDHLRIVLSTLLQFDHSKNFYVQSNLKMKKDNMKVVVRKDLIVEEVADIFMILLIKNKWRVK